MSGLNSSSSKIARAKPSNRSPGGPKLKHKSKSKSKSKPKSKSKSKLGSKSSSSADAISETEPRAKRQRQRLAADSLRWKSLNAGSFAGVDAGGGMMMLEELEGVGVEWEEDDKGRKVARFVAGEGKTKGKGKAKAKADDEDAPGQVNVDDDDDADVGSISGEEEGDQSAEEAVQWPEEEDAGLPSFSALEAEELDEVDDEENVEPEDTFDDSLLPEWKAISLHSSLKRSLLASGFVKPTDIQARSLPAGLTGRDVIGVAETGSGKTLAYSLPILSHLLRSPAPKTSVRRPLFALVLCPTRELALQVVEHLQRLLKHITPDSDSNEAIGGKKRPPRVSIGSVVGGLSAQKQKRIVERGCDVLVATPGRLWDLIKSDDELAAGIRGLRFLIIDEADRMIENGHFAELESIVRLTQRDDSQAPGPDDDDPVFAAMSTIFSETTPREDMQTFVFSATLSKDLQQNLKRRTRRPPKKGKRATALEDLVEKLDFRDENPEVIDLSPEGGVVKHLKESMVECVIADKASASAHRRELFVPYADSVSIQDLYLYYFLLRYPGRSLVFIGSIDGIRRLVPLFEVLQVPVYPLHSQLQQKQRLKNLDRFKASKHAVLIATDVAARGLDIPHVDHVIHFNLPRTADAYIHRSGRTARAQNPGFALQLCVPEERGMQRALMKSLGRTEELPDLPIDAGFMPKLKERIRLAKAIEKAQHEVKKENHEKNWLKETAEAMDLDLDPDMLSDLEHDPDEPTSRKGPKRKQGGGGPSANVANLKAELRERLAEPLMARGVSARYPTSGSKVIIDDLLAEKGHTTLLGAGTAKAWDEVQSGRKKLGNKRKRPQQQQH